MELKIGNLIAKLPIIQGGMGVGVSLSNLAGNVAKYGAIGVISAAHPGYLEKDFENNTLQANIRALKKHIRKAKEISNNGFFLVEYKGKRKIRQIKSLGNSKVLLVSNGGALMTETAEVKEIEVLAKLERIEIKL